MNLTFTEQQSPFRIRFAHPLTSEEMERFCATNEPVRVERDSNGELIVMTPVNSDGGWLENEVNLELGIWARRDGRGRSFGPTAGFTLPDTSVRAADAAWISLSRWHALTRDQQQTYAPICPEFVIEIRSRTDRLQPLEAKMEMWIANGTELAWLIDPQRKAVAIYRPGDSPRSTSGTNLGPGSRPNGRF